MRGKMSKRIIQMVQWLHCGNMTEMPSEGKGAEEEDP